MNKLVKGALALSSSAVLLVSSVVPVLANDMNVSIKDNGRDSRNKVNFDVNKELNITQRNHVNIHNNIHSVANTGFNNAGGNTNSSKHKDWKHNKNNRGGDVTIKTGNAESNVGVSNESNGNFLDLGSCGCMNSGGDVNLKIEGNGKDSKNRINFNSNQETTITQSNHVNIHNNIHSVANTGHNTASGNTGGDVKIDTGDATSNVWVDNLVNGNAIKF